MPMTVESDYDTGWREGYEAASGAAMAEAEDSSDEEIIDVLLPFQELRAEVERLAGINSGLVRDYNQALIEAVRQDQEIERLRAIEQAAQAWATAVEESDDDGEESEQYVDAAHALYVALGRHKAR